MMVSQPKWSQDEWIVALDFYFRHDRKIPPKTSLEIKGLSETLIQLCDINLSPDPKTLRNPAGVERQLKTFVALDPNPKHSVKNQNVSQGAREVWSLYAKDEPGRRQHTEAILAAIDTLKKVGKEELLASMDGIAVAKEGATCTRHHRVRERDRKIIQLKKDEQFKIHGALPCAICAFDYFQTYGQHGDGYIECHHTTPLAALPTERDTYLKDLILICASCHRMIHRKKEWLEVGQLREMWERRPHERHA